MSILDLRATSPDGRLWLVSNADGTHEIVTEAEKAGRGGFAPPWNRPYREILADFIKSLETSTISWLEFYAAYSKGECQTKGPIGQREMPAVHFVAGVRAYTAYIGTHHKGHFLGYGGARVTIAMNDGRTYESNNLWCGRDVPPALRNVLRNNATIKWH